MDLLNQAQAGPPRFRTGHVVLLSLFTLIGLSIIGVTGYFRLSPEVIALRASAMKSLGGQWNKKIALHVGSLTTGVVRTALRRVRIDPEPRAAIESLHGAEIGIYKLQPGQICDS